MHRLARSMMAAMLVVVAGPGGAQTALTTAMEEVRAQDWQAAERAVANRGAVEKTIIEWHRLRGGQGDFADFQEFVENHGDWPGMPFLMRRGEEVIPANARPELVRGYFADQPPQSGVGALRLAEALVKLGERQKAEDLAARAWRELNFDPVSESTMLAEFGQVLADHHVARMDNLLWHGRVSEAERMRPRVPESWRRLYDARVALRQDEPGVDTRIAAVPAELANDPGLAFERVEWRARKGRDMEAAALMRERSASVAMLGRPEEWASRRLRLARDLLGEGEAETAYLLAAQHQLTKGDDFAELEWLAGYIALRKLDSPAAALDHFRRFRLNVSSPISLGRAGYWEGRAHESMGQVAAAQAAYAFGAEFQTSFYGQLAAEKAGLPMDPLLAGGEEFPGAKDASFARSSVYLAGLALHEAGEETLAARFFSHLAESLDRTEIGQLTTLLEPLGSPYIQLQVAKRAASYGYSLHRAYFPLMTISTKGRPGVSPELALSIARRESEFNAGVVSHAGARGLMQLMPGTAQDTAGELGLPYALSRLTSDPEYNAALGTFYLQKLFDRFGRSPVLISSGYNAGPGRPLQWMRDYGDPRDETVDVVDWIEGIPFTETRNYVMRVTESLAPYRARLSGAPVPLSLGQELKAR